MLFTVLRETNPQANSLSETKVCPFTVRVVFSLYSPGLLSLSNSILMVNFPFRIFSYLTFSSVFNGTEGNSISLVFDGIETVDIVVTAWNNDNPDNLAEHDGAGTEVLTAQTVNLGGGTYVVQDKDIVYRDVDGIYKRAIADGSIKSKAVAMARIAKRTVVHYGLFNIDVSAFAVGDILYLSSTVNGGFSTLNNGIPLGIVLKSNLLLFTGFNGASDTDTSQTFDAVVSNVTGIGKFTSTQEAVNNVPTNSRILIDKLEDVKTTISTSGKLLEFVFNGLDKGWRKFAGAVASFRIDFDDVPDNGTWRMEWNGQESADLAFNAVAATIETEFNLFSGHTGVTVTGDYSAGFVFTFLDEITQPLPTFVDPVLNEIQQFSFVNVPTDGTI